jgi:hypothetical protein
MQGELAHHDRFASGVEERAIHPAFPVFENAHAGDLACEPLDILFPVDFFDSKKDKEARTDGGDGCFLDGDRGSGNALNDGPHVGSFSPRSQVSSSLDGELERRA